LDTRQIYGADAWVPGGYQSSDTINDSPADFGPVFGMPQNNPYGTNGVGGSVNSWDQRSQFGPPNSLNGGFRPSVSSGPSAPSPRPTANAMRPFSSSARAPYVGLLGQMARPGVYEITASSASLSELIERIGGLSKGASGQLRIIRNGRTGMTMNYSPSQRFELFAGDLVIADAQAASSTDSLQGNAGQTSRGQAAQTASIGAVQIGLVNLVDRPVVLKLRSEHASVAAILSLMRQDSALASQLQLVLPVNYRFQAAPKTDAPLPSEAVLIFPPNSVATDRLLPLPDPIKLDGPKSGETNSAPSDSPPASVSPDVTQWQDPQNRVAARQGSTAQLTPIRQTQSPSAIEIPPPPGEDFSSSEPSQILANRTFAPQPDSRSHSFGLDRALRDSQMVLAPPAERSSQDAASASEMGDAKLPTGNARSTEPLLFDAADHRRPLDRPKIEASHGYDEADRAALSPLDLDESTVGANNAASGLSIWPPLVTAFVGLTALIGISLALRQRTQQNLPTSALTTPDGPRVQPSTRHAPAAQLPSPPSVSPPPAARQELLDAIIHNQLPVTEEPIRFASPLQFHGRPVPPKILRVDDSHATPTPHVPNFVPTSNARPQVERVSAAVKDTSATKRRAVHSAATTLPSTSRPTVSGLHDKNSRTAPTGSVPVQPMKSGPLDRALSAVQQLDRALSAIQQREEHA
jgi:protein involved in polysaccharide export with SLBB domain